MNEMTPQAKTNFATEISFSTLLSEAKKVGLTVQPVMGLMYLPDPAVTRQWQEACRAVLALLSPEIER